MTSHRARRLTRRASLFALCSIAWAVSSPAQQCPQTLCSGDPCTVSGTTLLSDGCVLDWPGRDVTIGATAVLRQAVQPHCTVYPGAPACTLQSDCDNTCAGTCSHTGNACVTSNDCRNVCRTSPLPRVCTLTGQACASDSECRSICDGGSFTINARKLTVLGSVRQETGSGTIGLNLSESLTVRSSGRIDGFRDGVIGVSTGSASVEDNGWIRAQDESSDLTIDATGPFSMTSTPADGPGISVRTVTIDASEITVGSSGTSSPTISAGKDSTFSGNAEGGTVDLTAESGITIFDVVRAVGSGADSFAGDITLDAQSVTIAGTGVLTATASGTESSGGAVYVYAAGSGAVTVSGELNVEGGDYDGEIEIGSTPGADPLSAEPVCDIAASGARLLARSGTDRDGRVALLYRNNLSWGGATIRADTLDAFGGGVLVWCRDANRNAACDSPPQGTPSVLNPGGTFSAQPFGGCTGCGNGVQEGAEACDDGNMNFCDSCRPVTCAVTTPGAAGCNDGNVCTDDSCNLVSGCVHTNNTASCNDGNACTVSDHCVGGGCIGTPLCGNGTVNASCGEQCDDGNTNHLDGCRNDCLIPYCGDNLTSNGEQCDDGNTVPNDGCDAACMREVTINATLSSSESAIERCGIEAACPMNFGYHVANLNGRAVVSDPGGWAYGPQPIGGDLYVFDGQTGALLRHSQADQLFGHELSLVPVPFTERLLVGVTSLGFAGGQVSLYDFLSDTYPVNVVDESIPPSFGTSVASINGYIVVGSPWDVTLGADAGVVRVFNGFGQPVSTLTAPSIAASGRRMGAALSYAPVNTDVLVGMPGWNGGRGIAAIMNMTSGAIVAQFAGAPQVPGGAFGSALGMWGTNPVISAPGQRAVFVFNQSGGLLRTLSVPSASLEFGRAVAVIGNHILVGDPGDATRYANAGALHLFDAATGALIQSILAPSGTAFGRSVAGLGNVLRFVVGGNQSAFILTRPCGDGVVDPGETCDDGNALNGDCCTADCQTCNQGQSCGGCGGTCSMSGGNCVCS